MKVYKEFGNGWMVAMTEDCSRAIPGSVFRFGKVFSGRPSIEIYQPGATSGLMSFADQTEDQVRAFLVGLGFIEARRAGVDAADVSLEHIAKIIAPV